MPVLATISAIVSPESRRWGRVAELGRLNYAGPPGSTPLGRCHRPGVGGPLKGVGPFHLGEKGQQ